MSSKGFQLASGDTIAGYSIIRELGRGNNGIVYLAQQIILERMVACKILLPEATREPGYAEAFFREARNAAKLSHPNVVQALDVGEENGCCYFIMEYVPGKTLEDIRLENPARFTPKFLLPLAVQLADALDYAWRCHKMIHGDIKPENIILQDNGVTAKLADLGVARVAGALEEEGLMATPMYVAPEVVLGNAPPDPRSDIYSFGIMLYELFNGNPPFSGSSQQLIQKHINERPVPLSQAVPSLDAELAAYVDRMLAKSMDIRPQSWREVHDTLKQILERIKSVTNVPVSRPAEKKKKTEFVFPQWLKMLLSVAGAVFVTWLIVRLFG